MKPLCPQCSLVISLVSFLQFFSFICLCRLVIKIGVAKLIYIIFNDYF